MLVLYCIADKIPPAKVVYFFMCSWRLADYLGFPLRVQDFHQIQAVVGAVLVETLLFSVPPPSPLSYGPVLKNDQ